MALRLVPDFAALLLWLPSYFSVTPESAHPFKFALELSAKTKMRKNIVASASRLWLDTLTFLQPVSRNTPRPVCCYMSPPLPPMIVRTAIVYIHPVLAAQRRRIAH